MFFFSLDKLLLATVSLSSVSPGISHLHVNNTTHTNVQSDGCYLGTVCVPYPQHIRVVLS